VQVHMHSNVHHVTNNITGGLTQTFLHTYKAGGMFGVTFRGDASFVSKGLSEAIAELKKIASGTLSDEELNVVKNKVLHHT
jgi:hypothetical protein